MSSIWIGTNDLTTTRATQVVNMLKFTVEVKKTNDLVLCSIVTLEKK